METILILNLYNDLASKFGSETAEKIIQFIVCKIESEVKRQVQQGQPEEKDDSWELNAKKEKGNFEKLMLITWIFYYLSILFFIIVCLTR